MDQEQRLQLLSETRKTSNENKGQYEPFQQLNVQMPWSKVLITSNDDLHMLIRAKETRLRKTHMKTSISSSLIRAGPDCHRTLQFAVHNCQPKDRKDQWVYTVIALQVASL